MCYVENCVFTLYAAYGCIWQVGGTVLYKLDRKAHNISIICVAYPNQKGVACGKMNKIWVSQHVPLTSISFLVPCFYGPHKQQASRHPRKTVRPLALQNMPGLTTGPRAFAAVKVMGLEHLGTIHLKEIAH